MTRTPICIGAALTALSAILYACGGDSVASAFDRGGDSPAGGGDAGALGPTASEPGTNKFLDNAVLLVHAAKTQSFRLCFKNELDRRPQPDSQVMPESNVVGVEVGSAVRLPPLAGPPGEIFLFDEPLIRALYPQFGGAGNGPTCQNLLSASNPLSALAVSLGTIDADLSRGVHLLVVRGCPANGKIQTYSVAECGATWTAAGGNLGITELELGGAIRQGTATLPAQVVNLSQPLEGARGGRDVIVRFGDLVTPTAQLQTVITNPPLFGGASPSTPAQLAYPPEDQAVYARSGLRVELGGTSATTVLDQSLAAIQDLSSPRDVPPAYYAAASNYALLLLGDPDAKLPDGGLDPDERRRLHFLAVPVVEPKADAGDDAGGPVEGGAAPSK